MPGRHRTSTHLVATEGYAIVKSSLRKPCHAHCVCYKSVEDVHRHCHQPGAPCAAALLQEGAPPRHLIKVLWASSRLGLGLESGPGAERAAGREGGGRGGRGDADGVGTAVATASSELGSLERRAAERVAQVCRASGLTILVMPTSCTKGLQVQGKGVR